MEPVFANIRYNMRLTRFNHRGREKVNTQWNLYCMVHDIEKLAKSGQQARYRANLRQTVGMNTPILNLKLGYAKGVEQDCEYQVFLQPR